MRSGHGTYAPRFRAPSGSVILGTRAIVWFSGCGLTRLVVGILALSYLSVYCSMRAGIPKRVIGRPLPILKDAI